MRSGQLPLALAAALRTSDVVCGFAVVRSGESATYRRNTAAAAGALLRCADQGCAEGATSGLDQIAVASSSNATATRCFDGASTASS
jgi:hypothetical protein